MDTIIVSLVAGFCGWQWYLWRMRAISTLDKLNELAAKNNSGDEVLKNLEDERRLMHHTLMETFDWINENGDREDKPLMQVKNILAFAIQTSTYGRGS